MVQGFPRRKQTARGGMPVKSENKRTLLLILVMILVQSIAGCGGGEVSNLTGPTSDVPSASREIVMNWNAPQTYTDSTVLDPEVDLEEYEIYVNQTGTFSTENEPVAYVSAVNSSGNATTSFDLGALDYSFAASQTYYVCMRSVTKSGVKSEFSPVISFTI